MKKLVKILIWIFVVLLLLFVAIYFASKPLLKGVVDDKLKETRIAGLYKVDIEQSYFDIFNLGISLKGVELIPDSSTEAFKKSPQIAILSVKKVSLSYMNIWKLIQDNEFHIGKIKIIEPSLDLYFLDREKIDKNKKEEPKDSPVFSINGIQLKKMSVHLHLKDHSELTIDQLNFTISKPLIHPELFPDINNAIEYEKASLSLKDIDFTKPELFYHIKLDEIEVEEKFSKMEISGLRVKPKYDKKKFAEKHNYQIDRFDIELKTILISGFDLNRFLSEKVLGIQEIALSGLNMEVYRDKDRPFNFQKYPKLPQEQIRGIKQAIEIENINVEKAQFIYLERVVDAVKTGRVDFEDVQIEIRNFGNTESWKLNRKLEVEAKTRIYGKAPLYAQMNFPLGSNTFYVSGQVKKAPMNVFNEIVLPNTDVEIENGTIDKLDFNFKANKTSSTGEMIFLYSDLEIEILKEEKTGELKKRKLLNFVVNNILPKHNPNKKGEEYHGIIGYDRDLNKGVFNYLWKSVFTGIKDTFLKENKDIQEYTIEKEQEKASKKEAKKKKREERRKARKAKKDSEK